MGDNNEVISVNRLMDKPFKHAGGCQVYHNYLAVGIEDNEAKDKSKVCIYDISNPENPSTKPLSVIERDGPPLRSTARCVGIINYNNRILLVVGDWDTKNLDFYSCNSNDFLNETFKLISSVNTETISRKGWIDKNWASYQNINLVNLHDELYLIGLGQNSKKEDIADLYKLSNENSEKFILTKIACKTFKCTNKFSFKAAAGVAFTKNGKLKIISSGYNLENISFFNDFNNSKK